jgi:hypothetical protein
MLHPCPAHLPRLECPNYVWRTVQVMMLLLILSFSSISYPFNLFGPNILLSTEQPNLRHLPSTFFPWCQRPSFIPIQNYKKIIVFRNKELKQDK